MNAPIRSPVMVGRDDELARLEDALLSARRGDGCIVVLCGDAGVGKSRLVAELQRRAIALGCAVLGGECSEAKLSLPYLPFVEAIGNRLATADVDALAAALGADAAALGTLFPRLAIHGQAASVLDTADPAIAKLRLFDAIAALLQAVSAANGLLLVVEDIHWADASTQELLDYLTRRLRDSRILVLATHRSVELDRRHPMLPSVQGWRRAGLSETIELRPLGTGDVASMVMAIFDTETVTPEFATFLEERTDGLPFAIEELLKDAVDRGHIWRAAGGGWDRAELTTLRPPRSIADGILRRVERLDPQHAAVLRAAAVLGRSCDFTALVALAEQPEAAVLDAIDVCVAEQLLEEDAQREDGYRFRHALTWEAVYKELIHSRRRLMHARAAEVVRALRPDALIDIAGHLVAAGRWNEASPACAAAAEDALRRLAPREACDLFEQAVQHAATERERGRLRCRLGEAWHRAGDVAAAQRHLEEGVALLETSGDVLAAAHHRLSLGRCCWERSRHEQARGHYERARAVLAENGPSEDLATAYVRLSELAGFELEGPEAQRLAERAIGIADEAGADAARVAATDSLGTALCDQGLFDEGVIQLRRSANDAEAKGMLGLAARSLSHAISALESYGRVRDCGALLERLRALPRDPWLEAVIPYYEGWMRFWSGDLHGAVHAAETCVSVAESRGIEAPVAWGRALQCVVETELGHIDSARRLLPAPAADAERQELLEQRWVALRHMLAAGDAAAAGTLAAAMREPVWVLAGTAASDTVVEGLVAAGLIDEARALVIALAAEPRARMHTGHLLRAQGRVALASVDHGSALASLLQARVVFAEGGYALERLRTDGLVAEAQLGTGDREGAAEAVESALAKAYECGAAVIARQVRALADRLGLHVKPRVLAEPEATSAAEAPTGAPPREDVGMPAIQAAGERMVTVLFADIRGYTEMSRSQTPAAMIDRTAAMQRWARVAVERHHGIVDKFAGDAVMATFNVSGAHVDHTLHALDVALRLIDMTAQLQLPLGIGMAAGPAIVGRLTDGANVTVMGPTTNLAARLHGEAQGGELPLSADAYARVRDSLLLRDHDAEACELALKGFDAPVVAYRLRQRRTSPSAP